MAGVGEMTVGAATAPLEPAAIHCPTTNTTPTAAEAPSEEAGVALAVAPGLAPQVTQTPVEDADPDADAPAVPVGPERCPRTLTGERWPWRPH